jgi:hypothetical protein
MLEVLEDAAGKWALSDVLQNTVSSRFQHRPGSGDGLHFGFTKSVWWLRLSLSNPGQQALQRLLEVGDPGLASVQFYQAQPDGSFVVHDTGNTRPFANRAYPNRQFVFALTLPPHSQQVHYLRVASRHAMLVSAQLWAPDTFRHTERSEYSVQAGYFGMACAMILFNLLLFFALRESIYLYYVAFATCFAGSLGLRNGMASEFLPQALEPWVNPALSPSIVLVMCTLLLFMRNMLGTRSFAPWLDRLCRYMIVLELILGAGLVLYFDVTVRIATYLHMLVLAGIFGVSIVCARQRIRSAQFFLAAFSALLLGGMLTGLRTVGWIASSYWNVHAMQVGSVLEMLLLAFALADRLNRILREKENARSEALAAQQQLLDNLRQSEALLEQRVSERSQALLLSNQTLSGANAELGAALRESELLRQQADTARQHSNQLGEQLQRAQEQLVQAEKMAALGQLIFQVAQEIHHPINTIKHCGQELITALHLTLAQLPMLVQTLSHEQQIRLLALMQQKPPTAFSLPPLLANHAGLIEPVLAWSRSIQSHTRQINTSAERVNQIIKSLKNFAYQNHQDDQGDLQLRIDSLIRNLENATPPPAHGPENQS